MRATSNRIGVLLAAIATALLLGCGGGGGGPTGTTNNNNTNTPPGGGPGGTSTDITVSGYSFSPSATTVAKGATVNWSWNSCTNDGYGGQSCVDHNLVWDDGTAGVASTSSGSYSRTFAAAGTYGYHCSIHGTSTTGMRGTVTVQ